MSLQWNWYVRSCGTLSLALGNLNFLLASHSDVSKKKKKKITINCKCSERY